VQPVQWRIEWGELQAVSAKLLTSGALDLSRTSDFWLRAIETRKINNLFALAWSLSGLTLVSLSNAEMHRVGEKSAILADAQGRR
jgi:hypothetical protein